MSEPYKALESRYDHMQYRRCGQSGLQLSALTLGLWYNFSADDPFNNIQAMCREAFDLGICSFDLANNYGVPPGSAEENFGRILKTDFAAYRDELVISSKAGYLMWPGPYGEWGSRKYLIASCDQSLKRMGLDYVDIFYSHRPDPDTPLEETMGALEHIVKTGRALYVGISTYDHEDTRKAYALLKEMNIPCLIHQVRYNMFDRWIEEHLLGTLDDLKVGCMAFSPICQGILSDKYVKGIPEQSRHKKLSGQFHWGDSVNEDRIAKVLKLNEVATERSQDLAQMAIAWVLRHSGMTSALFGASSVKQIQDAVKSLDHLDFSPEELKKIDEILSAN
jgi:L-glyceraldehyde 3-phosphate reductase